MYIYINLPSLPFAYLFLLFNIKVICYSAFLYNFIFVAMFSKVQYK